MPLDNDLYFYNVQLMIVIFERNKEEIFKAHQIWMFTMKN